MTSLVVQWLRFHAPNAGGPSSIPGQGTSSHMPQLKILCSTTKIQCSQINRILNIYTSVQIYIFTPRGLIRSPPSGLQLLELVPHLTDEKQLTDTAVAVMDLLRQEISAQV